MLPVMTNEILHKSFKTPDQTMTPPNTKVEIVKLGDYTFTKYTFQPGWRWSKDIKPIMKTDFDQVPHVAYQISGRMVIKLAQGKEVEVGPDEPNIVPAGHDAWVIGNEPAVYLTVEMGTKG
ncbi:cupin domain-containing protein [Dehalogenimonas etheniformans]|nr:cupin domain-containing protein [Dehalogenimonas etheniformans]